jgi:thiol:disulfide interchange protein DsbD
MKRLLILLLAIIPILGNCQFPDPNPGKPKLIEPTKWKVAYSKSEVKIGDKVDIIISVEIENDWYIYTVGENPPYASVDFASHPSYSLVGKIKEGPGIKQKHDENLEIDVKYYEKKAEFRQTVKILKANPVIKIEIQGQACSIVNGQCVLVPRIKEYEPGKIKVIADASTKAVDTAKINDSAVASVDTNNKAPEDSSKVIPTTNTTGNIPQNPAEKYADKINETTTSGNISLLALIILAFGGGLVSLLTPCVFPMVPLTVTFFTNASESRGQAFKKAFVYGTSIVFIFTVIGLIISWTLGPQFATFLSNHWIPNIMFFLIFMVFGLSFLGLFEITLPNSLVNKMDAHSDKGGYIGIFFMALTLVLVSFSCTAPIVSPLLIESARGEAIRPVIGMLAYSSAFALPFTLFALFPGLLAKLPKSGGWMNVIKVTLGFIEVALAFKFLSSVDRVYTLHLLDRDIFIAIWIVVFTLLGIYLLGKIRLPHDSATEVTSVPRLIMAIITFTFVVYLLPGMFGAPLNLLSGVLPPMSTHNFDVPGIIRNYSSKGKVLCDEPKHNKKYSMPHGLKGYFDYEQALQCAKKTNKPLFIDFTGLNCANCIKMEENVWADQEVLNILNNDYVLVSLYTDDPTSLAKEEMYESSYGNGKIRTIGEKNNDIEIGKFGSNALPIYALVDPHTEKPLVPTVGYTPSVVQYVDYLKSGVSKYKSLYGK